MLDAAGFGADFSLPQPRIVALCGLYLLTLHSDRGSVLTLTERILGVTCGGNCLKDLLFLSGLHLLPLGAAFFLSVAGTNVDVLKPVKAFERNISFKPSSAVLKASLFFCFCFGLGFVGSFSKDKEDTSVLCGLSLDADHSHGSTSCRVAARIGYLISQYWI